MSVDLKDDVVAPSKVTDHRRVGKPERNPKPWDSDPVEELVKKVLVYCTYQPEWPIILSLPRPVRKQIARDIANVITRIPSVTSLQRAKSFVEDKSKGDSDDK